MNELPAILASRKAQIEALCRRHHVRTLDAFGSVMRGEPGDGFERFDPSRSDLDFIVRFDPEGRKPWGAELTELQSALEQLFGRRVDLIEETSWSNAYFAAKVRQERMPLYAAA